MRIAQVSPLFESVPPRLYGGTERVVSYLTEELVRRGHEVSLFASGDSRTAARLVPASPRSLRLDRRCRDQLAHHVVLLEKVLREAPGFDIVHFHLDYIHFPLSRRLPTAHVTTEHGRLDLPDLVPLFREFQEVPLVSISNAQRAPLAFAHWTDTVYHGLPSSLYAPTERGDGYLAFLGRLSPEKRVDRAIEIARRTDRVIKISAKVDEVNGEYFDQVVRPMLRWRGVEFVGEIGEEQKGEFLGGADALLFPIDWPEPFGLVMIEALACGTPVVAFRAGSVPEVLEDGVTGFIVDRVDDAVRAVQRLSGLDRRRCRAVFEERFSAERMAGDYLDVYRRLLEGVPHPQAVR